MSKYAFHKFVKENRGKKFKIGKVKSFTNNSAVQHLTVVFNHWLQKQMLWYSITKFQGVNKHVMGKWVDTYLADERMKVNDKGVLTI